MTQCSVCSEEKPIIKNMRGKGGFVFHYCKDCWNLWYKKSNKKVLKKIEEAKQAGKKIGITETIAIVKEVLKGDEING